MEKIKLRFVGIDNWNRPVWKDSFRREYYGSVDHLFNEDAQEEEVLKVVELSDLCYFGDHFGCEPMGTSVESWYYLKEDLTKYTDNELLTELESRGYVRHVWHVDDVKERLSILFGDDQQTYTPEDAEMIADELAKIDANIGINWEVIDTHIWNYFNEKEKAS